MQSPQIFSNLIRQIERNLCNKYDHAFSFYKVRQINQFLSRNHACSQYIYLNDVRFLIEDIQFLRRVYYYSTPSGKPQIENRIQICSDYYCQQIKQNQYPKMLVTDKKSIITNRLKRFRKMKAEQGSSDQTQQKKDEQFVDFYQPESLEFLKDLSVSQSKISVVSQEMSYESSFHEIYNPQVEDNIKSDSMIRNIRTINESCLNHLICDLGQFKQNPEQKTKQARSYSYIQKSITVTPIDQSIVIKTKKQKQKSTISSYLQSLKQKRQVNSSQSQQRLVGSLQISSKRQMSTQQSLQKIKMQKIELQTRRNKIRQKAELLLKKVLESTKQDNQNYF